MNLVFFLLAFSILTQHSECSIQFSDIQNQIPTWMTNQITQDFESFVNTGISTEEIDKYMACTQPWDGMVRYKILNGHISIVDSEKIHPHFAGRPYVILEALQKVVNRYELPDLDIVVCMHDAWNIDENQNIPILVFAKNKKFSKQILIPDWEALLGHDWGLDFVNASKKIFPWRMKLETSFWRGATTGGNYQNDSWKESARCKLVLSSLKYPELIDARFTLLVQGAEQIQKMKLLVGNCVTPLNSLKYKYLIDVDGNSCAYGRCYWTLLSNSVVLKQTSDNIQWYYGAISPYLHYIPVANDLHDLISQIKWAKNNDENCQKISEFSTEFVLNELNEEKIHLYLYAVLMKYADLQKFKPSSTSSNNTQQADREKLLIEHVKNSIAKADRGISKLNNDILHLEGMSSPKGRHLLNNLCSLPRTNYLEIGCWKGSTLISALFKNQSSVDHATALDNWAEFGGPFQEFKRNCERFLPKNSYQFFSVNSFSIDPLKIIKQPVNIYFYDGDHSALAQQLAFEYYNQILDNVFIAIVDDWDHLPVQEGTYRAFKNLNYKILFEIVLPARFNGDTEQWWNGLYVAVIRK